MDLAEFKQFAEQLAPGDASRGGPRETVPSNDALQVLLAALAERQERHLQLPLIHPDRQPFRFDVFKAWRHFQNIKADKEQTSEAFCLFNALPWRNVDVAAKRFLDTEHGRAIYASEPFLPDLLDDHAALRRMPKGTLAHDYCDFMERDGLTAAGLVSEYEHRHSGEPRIDDKIEWYVDRLRDTHDLLHVLTVFRRDSLGEQCVLAFVFHQRPSWGHIALAYGGTMVTGHATGTYLGVLRAVREAQLIGQSCPPIAEESVRDLLATPTDAVRQRFGIRPARLYGELHRKWREAGIEPN